MHYVIIGSMGKTGSNTFNHSFIKANVDIQSYPYHNVSSMKERLSILLNDVKSTDKSKSEREIKKNNKTIRNIKRNITILVGTRDYNERNISWFFEICTSKIRNCYIGSKTDILNMPIDDLIRAYNESNIHNEPEEWFTKFKTEFNIDINDHNLDNGYVIIERDQYNIILYKLSKLNDNRKFFEDYFKCKIIDHNLSKDKWYADKIQEFRAKINNVDRNGNRNRNK